MEKALCTMIAEHPDGLRPFGFVTELDGWFLAYRTWGKYGMRGGVCMGMDRDLDAAIDTIWS